MAAQLIQRAPKTHEACVMQSLTAGPLLLLKSAPASQGHRECAAPQTRAAEERGSVRRLFLRRILKQNPDKALHVLNKILTFAVFSFRRNNRCKT